MKNLILFLLAIIFIVSACNKEDSPNLSFAGITIGKEFPDSLKSKYEYLNTAIPQYEGKILFNLPNHSDVNVSVVAATDLNEEEVICIQIGNLNIEQSSDFFEMLKSKYGLPKSQYGNTDVKLDRLIANIFSDLGYSYYNEDVDVSGDRVLAVWKSVLGNTDIIMIGKTYHSPHSYSNNKPWTYVYFKYVDQEKFIAAQKQSESNKISKKREEYRKNNSKYMNQDF